MIGGVRLFRTPRGHKQEHQKHKPKSKPLDKFVTPTNAIIAAVVAVLLFTAKCWYDSRAASRKAAVRLLTKIDQCLYDLAAGGDGRIVPIDPESFNEFLLTVPKRKRPQVEHCWKEYVASQSRPDYVECSLRGLRFWIDRHT